VFEVALKAPNGLDVVADGCEVAAPRDGKLNAGLDAGVVEPVDVAVSLLDVVGFEALRLLKSDPPVDTGALRPLNRPAGLDVVFPLNKLVDCCVGFVA
jgi:hypothetical protein